MERLIRIRHSSRRVSDGTTRGGGMGRRILTERLQQVSLCALCHGSSELLGQLAFVADWSLARSGCVPLARCSATMFRQGMPVMVQGTALLLRATSSMRSCTVILVLTVQPVVSIQTQLEQEEPPHSVPNNERQVAQWTHDESPCCHSQPKTTAPALPHASFLPWPVSCPGSDFTGALLLFRSRATQLHLVPPN